MSSIIHTGDALEILRTMPGESFDAVVTDPPYGMDFQSDRRIKSARLQKIANDKNPFIWWLYDAIRVTKTGGALVSFCDWKNSETWRMAITAAGWEIKSQVIWDRMNHGMGDLKAMFGPRHDVIWFAVKGKFQFPGKMPASVLPFMRINGEQLVHPNQKPPALMEYICRVVCPPGGTVLDPFAGSGSTGEGAMAAGCNFVGCELDPGYAALSRKRLDDLALHCPLTATPHVEPTT